jgi:hypothetical protein
MSDDRIVDKRMARDVCPYCLLRPRDSDDHVFPDFLGGTTTIRTCTQCNNKFGHRFEGPVSKDLAPIIVFLSLSGYKHGRLVIYERAYVGDFSGTEIEYDMDSEGQSYPHKPHLIREEGKVMQIVARSESEARKIVASLKAKGQLNEVAEREEIRTGLRPPLRDLSITVGTEMRQLVVKMCASLGQVISPDIPLLDKECREFLLDEAPSKSPVRWTHARYPGLDTLCPPLAHVIYIEGDSASARAFGVVQFFGGAFQFYVPLSNSYTGRSFAAIGIFDITTHREQFREVERLQMPEAPQFGNTGKLEEFYSEWEVGFNAQIKAAFGENGIIFGMSPKQSVAGLRVTLPLLWVEHPVQFQLSMRLAPDQPHSGDVTLSSRPSEWIFSPDFGVTRLRIFDSFVQKWNQDNLNRALGQEHLYVPEEVVPGVRLLIRESVWCPVHSMSIIYIVNQQAWLGSLNLSDCSGELDRPQHTLRTNFRLTDAHIPVSRDPSWPPIADPDSFIKTSKDVVVVEKWGLSASDIRFSNLGMVAGA